MNGLRAKQPWAAGDNSFHQPLHSNNRDDLPGIKQAAVGSSSNGRDVGPRRDSRRLISTVCHVDGKGQDTNKQHTECRVEEAREKKDRVTSSPLSLG